MFPLLSSLPCFPFSLTLCSFLCASCPCFHSLTVSLVCFCSLSQSGLLLCIECSQCIWFSFCVWQTCQGPNAVRITQAHVTNPQTEQCCVNAAYHHFGMISPFKVARDLVRNSSNGSKKFFDEFMTWRELSYAFCFQHWPDLESIQVILQCPCLVSLALLSSALTLHVQHAWHTCAHLRSR